MNWNLFHKGPDSTYFKFYGLYALCHNFSTLLLYCESSHKQYVSGCVCRSSFTTTSHGLDLSYSLLTSELEDSSEGNIQICVKRQRVSSTEERQLSRKKIISSSFIFF